MCLCVCVLVCVCVCSAYLPPALSSVGDLVGSHAHVGQDLGDAPGVNPTVGSHVSLTAPMHVHLTH